MNANIAEVLVGQASERPDAPALIETRGGRDRILTFGALERHVGRAAAALERAGLKAGDRVLFLHGISNDLFVALVGTFRMGGVAVFLDPSAGLSHIDRCCAMAPPAAIVGGWKTWVLGWLVPGLRACPRWLNVTLPASELGPPPPIAPRTASDPALLTFTSGSTGLPKAAVRTHGFLRSQHRVLERAIRLQPGEVDLTTLPIFVLANLGSGVTSLLPDGDLRRPGQIRPEPILAQMRRFKPSRSAASPAFFERLCDGLARDGRRAESLRQIFTGGAPVFPRTLQRMKAAFPESDPEIVYGSTEAEPMSHVRLSEIGEDAMAQMQSGAGLLVGRPIEEIALAILPDRWGQARDAMSEDAFEREHLPQGAVGEIVVAGDHVLPGYLDGQGDAETKVRVGDRIWHRTGDAGTLDANGRLWLHGRCAARISDSRGTLYPFTVECAASFDPGLARTALLARDGERVLVIERAQDAASWDEAAFRARLAWARIDRFESVRRIPVDGRHNAKVDYPALIKLLNRR